MRGGKAQRDAEAAEPERAPEDAVTAAAERILADMLPEEKAWQMLVLFPQQITGAAGTGNRTLWASGFAARGVGGVVFDGENMASETELRGMLAAAGMTAKIFLPKKLSMVLISEENSMPPTPFSIMMDGAPIMATGRTKASSGTSIGSIMSTCVSSFMVPRAESVM